MPRLRAGLVPGTVVVLLSGRFAGKRAVFLKQLESGLILVTGPFRLNGIPLRRVAQRHVIPTSTRIEVPTDIASSINDSMFKAVKKTATEQPEERKGKKISDEVSRIQTSVDTSIMAATKGTPLIRRYMRAHFGLQRGDRPHRMKF